MTTGLEPALDDALATLRANIAVFDGSYPDDTTAANVYPLRKAQNGIALGGNSGWTTGFWPGMYWLAWELTGDEQFRANAARYAEDFAAEYAQRRTWTTTIWASSSRSRWSLHGASPATETRVMRHSRQPTSLPAAFSSPPASSRRGET